MSNYYKKKGRLFRRPWTQNSPLCELLPVFRNELAHRLRHDPPLAGDERMLRKGARLALDKVHRRHAVRVRPDVAGPDSVSGETAQIGESFRRNLRSLFAGLHTPELQHDPVLLLAARTRDLGRVAVHEVEAIRRETLAEHRDLRLLSIVHDLMAGTNALLLATLEELALALAFDMSQTLRHNSRVGEVEIHQHRVHVLEAKAFGRALVLHHRNRHGYSVVIR